jgi:hypothetical protein
MNMVARLSRKAAGPLAVLAVTCLACAAALPAQAEQEVGSPKWAAEQFKQIGLKPAPNTHGFLSSVKIAGEPGRSAQVIGVVHGTDPLLAKDVVLVTGRLDAAGEAAVMDVARAVAGATARPRRSIVFVLSAAEGADRRAAASSDRIVADISLDALSAPDQAGLTLRAADETSLGRDAGELASAAGLTITRVAADPKAYGYLSLGVPTLSIGLGAQGLGAQGLGAQGLGAQSPSAQTTGADQFAAYLAALVSRVAGRDERPAWAPGSRFAPPAPRAAEVLTDPVHMPLGHRPQPAIQAYG